MADMSCEPAEAHNSDNDFEKVAFITDEGNEISDRGGDAEGTIHGLSSTVCPEASDDVPTTVVQKRPLTRKSMLEAKILDEQHHASEKVSWSAAALDPRVQELIYWRNVRKTLIVFATSLLIFVCLYFFSIICLISYLSLFVLTVTFAYRLYGNVVGYIWKTKEKHCLDKYLEKEVSIPSDAVNKFADQLVENVSRAVDSLRRLFLVEKAVDSLKFALVLWLVTFISSWFSGISLMIIGDILIFTVPKFCQVYQKQIDDCTIVANAKLEILCNTLKEKLQRKTKNE